MRGIRLLITVTLALLLAGVPVAAQAGAEGRLQVHPLRSIEPRNEDWSDLEPLRAMIGDARVVQLGEYGHGLGDSYDARNRITRFLHQEMGFDIVIFESPMFLSGRMNRELATEVPLEEAIDLAIFPGWAHSEQVMGLFRYIQGSRNGERPIDLYSVDSQLMPEDGQPEAIADEIRRLLGRDPDPVTAALMNRLESLIGAMRLEEHLDFRGEAFARGRALLTDLEFLLRSPAAAVRAATTPNDRQWGLRMIATLGYMLEDRAVRSFAPPFTGDIGAYAEHPGVHHGQNRRDQAMATNIEWIVETLHPGRKAVVWLSNSHASEAAGFTMEGRDGLHPVRQHTTGSYLSRMLGDEVFTLLASCYEGRRAGNFRRTAEGSPQWIESAVDSAPPGTIAFALHEQGVDHGYIDLRTVDIALGLGFRWDPEDTSLAKQGDALLFVDRDRPSQPRAGLTVDRR